MLQQRNGKLLRFGCTVDLDLKQKKNYTLRKGWESGIGERNEGTVTNIVDIPCRHAMRDVESEVASSCDLQRKTEEGERMVVLCQVRGWPRSISAGYLTRLIDSWSSNNH
jgi:hypothetical protein